MAVFLHEKVFTFALVACFCPPVKNCSGNFLQGCVLALKRSNNGEFWLKRRCGNENIIGELKLSLWCHFVIFLRVKIAATYEWKQLSEIF